MIDVDNIEVDVNSIDFVVIVVKIVDDVEVVGIDEVFVGADVEDVEDVDDTDDEDNVNEIGDAVVDVDVVDIDTLDGEASEDDIGSLDTFDIVEVFEVVVVVVENVGIEVERNAKGLDTTYCNQSSNLLVSGI